MKKKKIYWILLIIGIFVQTGSPRFSQADQIQSVETEGSIGFTGTYVPIGTPDPRPPIQEISKPDGSLPQTNMANESWPVWLGFLIICIVFLVKRKKKERGNV